MADLGTVVGVVSLSLQVFEYVHTYVDALQGREEDLASTTRHCDTMQKLLAQTKTLQEKHPTSVNISSTAVKQAMSATAAEMTLLRDLIAKIAPNHPQPKSIAGRLEKQKQRMLYPFRRSNLEQLDERLARANEALQSTLQLAVLEITTETGDILKDLQMDLGSSRADMNDRLDNLQGISQQGLGTISASYQETSLMRAELQLLIPQSTSQARVSLEKIQNIERHVDGSSSLISETHQNTLDLRKRVDELTTMLKDLRSPTAGVFCQKLISKPSTLRLICDQVSGKSSDQLSEINLEDTYSSLFSCSCHRRRRRQRKRQQFGRAFLAQEIFTDNAHSPGCSFYNLSQPQTSRSIGISVTMFRAAVSVALKFTMNSPSGAGGFGICPSFTYYPVNPGSPAVMVFEILFLSYKHTSGHESPRVVEKSLEVLRWIFKTGRASPFDRTTHGSTLLHALLEEGRIVRGLPGYLDVLLRVAKFLVAAGVPRDKEHGETSMLPWHEIVYLTERFDYWRLKIMQQLLKVCWIDDPSTALDLSFGRVFDIWSPTSFSTQQMLYHSLNDQAEWLGNGLHLAILRKDTNRLLEVLTSCPPSEDFHTQDAFGATALQMAVSWPEGLRLILDQIDYSVLQDHDEIRDPLLLCAFRLSRGNCSKDYTLRCADSCFCADAVTLLLEAKCQMLFCGGPSSRANSFHSATTRCKEVFAHHLKKRRQELAKLALFNLHPRDVARFNLKSPSILDFYTADVIAALSRQGVHVPRWLHTASPSRCGNSCTRTCTQTIYRTIAKTPFGAMDPDPIATLNMFYSAGFMDIDVASSPDDTPIMLVTRPDVSVWFLQHGVDLFPQMTPAADYVPGYRLVHHLFRRFNFGSHNLRYQQQQQQQQQQQHIMQLTEKLHEHPCNDCCLCGCSESGCHPWTMVWKRSHTRSADLSLRSNFDFVVQHRNQYLEKLGDLADAPAGIKAIALRTITFEALPVRHTCCRNGWKRQNMDEDEIREIREEDADELDRLEKLLTEFEEEMDMRDCSLGHFFRTYWDDRMWQVLQEIDKQTITEENQKGAAELGVRLKARRTSCWQTGLHVWERPDYWLTRLDNLME